MATDELMTVGKIATELKVSPGQVKKAIAELKIKPTSKKGACSYYAAAIVPRVRSALA